MINIDDHFIKGSSGYETTSQALAEINRARQTGDPNLVAEADRLEANLEAAIFNAKKSKGKDFSGFNAVVKSVGGLGPQVNLVTENKNKQIDVINRVDNALALSQEIKNTIAPETLARLDLAKQSGNIKEIESISNYIDDTNKSTQERNSKIAEEQAKAEIAIKQSPKKTVGDISFEQNATAALRYANELESTIKQYGTFEAYNSTGSAKLAQLPYQMAIAYAKTVDPTSVAREGEVDAAKKYLIPIGMDTRDETALAALRGFRKDIEERVEQYKKSTGSTIGVPEEKVKTQTTNQNAPITKNRPPLKGLDGKREEAAPNNMMEEETTPTNSIEAANIFFNKNRSPK